MTISFDIPRSVEAAIGGAGGDAAAALKEAGLIELYRMGVISHGQLAEGLGTSRSQADAVLRRHNVVEDLMTTDELAARVEAARKLAG